METGTLAKFALKVERLERGLTSPEAKKYILQKLGQMARDDYKREIAADLGPDLAMSNWRRSPKRQIRFNSRSRIAEEKSSVFIYPVPVGPFKVLDVGRSAGYSRKGRPVSKSRGKGTSARAQNRIEAETPIRAHRMVTRAVSKALS